MAHHHQSANRCCVCNGQGKLESITRPGIFFPCVECEGTGFAEPDLSYLDASQNEDWARTVWEMQQS